MSGQERRPWWLAGQNVPATAAWVVANVCFASSIVSFQLPGRSTGRAPAGSLVFVWFLVGFVLVGFVLVGAAVGAATILTLWRHLEWVRQPADPMSPRGVRIWWSIGSTLAVVGVLGLAPVAMGSRGAVIWLQPGATIVASFIFLMLARRTGQRVPAATNAPPTST